MTPDQLHDALRELAAETLPVRIAGECMYPHLKDGARIRVRSSRCYWPGDVLVVQAWDGRLLAHRLIGGYWRGWEWRWLTQADAGSRPDASVTDQRVLGKVCGGECSPLAVRVPFRHRLWALGRFVRFGCRRLGCRQR